MGEHGHFKRLENVLGKMPSANRQSNCRALHSNSKSGCLTCKKRHLKCDESKPTCQRCLKAFRECVQPADCRDMQKVHHASEALEQRKQSIRSRSFRRFVQPTYTIAGPIIRSSEVEHATADACFTQMTLPLLCQLEPCGHWLVQLLELRRSNPLLQLCCLALGSVHASVARNAATSTPALDSASQSLCRKACNLQSDELVVNDLSIQRSPSNDSFATQQYLRALYTLRKQISAAQIDAVTLRLTTILLVLYESLLGHQEEALVHLRLGLSLTQPSTAASFQHTSMGNCPISRTDPEQQGMNSLDVCIRHKGIDCSDEDRSTFVAIHRLALYSSLLGPPVADSILQKLGLQLPEFCSSIPAPLDLRTARLGMDVITGLVLKLASASSVDLTHASSPIAKAHIGPVPGIDCLKEIVRQKLLHWRLELDLWCLKNSSDPLAVKNENASNALIAQYELALILLESCGANDETTYDAHITGFQRIVTFMTSVVHAAWGSNLQRTAEGILRDKVSSLDFGVIYVLFATALKCRDRSLRRMALQLLRQGPKHEVIWDTRITAQAVELVIEFEENGMSDSDVVVPSANRVHAVNIQPASANSGTSKALVTLFIRPVGSNYNLIGRKFFI